MISSSDIMLLLPEIVLSVAVLIVMLSIAIKRNHSVSYVLTLIGTAAAFGSLFYVSNSGQQLTTLFIVDGFSNFFTGLILVSTFIIAVFAFPYLKSREKIQHEEFYILLLLATIGAISMVISNHFISFVLSLEVMSVALYALISYLKDSKFSVEAGIKYLVMAGVSSAILLFGFAMLYMHSGEMELSAMRDSITENTDSVFFMGGMALTLVGLGFKLALVPFHLWTPDIYAGAPAPVSAYVATISKGSVFAFLLRFYFDLNGPEHNSVWMTFAGLAIVSMLFGNWLALQQKNIKRLLAYSSIGHLGYMIVALLAVSQTGAEAASFYLVAYFISMLAAFGIVGYLSRTDSELLNIDDYKGLFWKKPWVAALFSAVLLSLAGIPLTAGFLGKFYLLLAGVGKELWLLTIVLVLSSGIGLYYYLKVVVAMFSQSDTDKEFPTAGASMFTGVVFVVLFIFLFWVGMFPSGLIETIHSMVGSIF